MSTEPKPRTLSARTAIAAAWVVGAQFIAKFADFLTLLILARFLSPQDFGLVAMAMTAVLITEAITELPLVQAIVRADEVSEAMFDTAFTLSLLRGLAITAVLLLLSWPLARFYGEPRVQALSCVLALAPALRGLASPKLALYMRALDYRPEFRLMVVARVVTLACASAVALATGSYWAIALGTLVAPTARLALSYALCPYRPRLGLSEWPLFADLVGWNSLAQLFSAINWQMGRILLGRLVETSALGFYTMATTIVALPYQALLQPLSRPLMGAFSDASRRGAVRPAVMQSSYALVAVGAPFLLVLSVLARPIVLSVLGEQWLASAPLLRWEALAALVAIPLALLSPLAMTLGRTRFVAARNAVETLVALPTMLVAISLYGVTGAVYARVVTVALLFGLNVWMIGRLLGEGARPQVVNLLRPFAALGPALVALLLGEHLVLLDLEGPALVLGTGLVAGGGLLVYVGSLGLLWRVVGSPAGPEARLVGWLAGARRARGGRKPPRRPA